MSHRVEMGLAARRGAGRLGPSAGQVRSFILQHQHASGAFMNRAGAGDLYYTVFGLEGLAALEGAPGCSDAVDAAALHAGRYLESLGAGEGLDWVHLCCLARAWAALRELRPATVPAGPAASVLLGRVEQHRSGDGGYGSGPGAEFGTAYACYLALGVFQDLSGTAPNPEGIFKCLDRLKVDGDAYTNYLAPGMTCDRRARIGSTNATAAAVAALSSLGKPASAATGRWLLEQASPEGGFLALPNAPLPDLLSTATALHALAGLGMAGQASRERHLDFLDSLWTNQGGFHGHWADEQPDLEYTFYGLLALGVLDAAASEQDPKH